MLTPEARRRFERQVAGGEAREQVGGGRRLPELGQAKRAGHPTEDLPRPLTTSPISWAEASTATAS